MSPYEFVQKTEEAILLNRLRQLTALVLFAVIFVAPAQSKSLKHEAGVGYASVEVDGQDSGFPLDGSTDGIALHYGVVSDSGLVFDARLTLGDGDFTLTTGEKTDYESRTIDLRVGKSFCLSESCATRIKPYAGINRFSSENRLTAFATQVEVDQDRTKIPLGTEVIFSRGTIEFGADLQLGYKFEENQKIPALSVDQDAASDWTLGVEFFVRHTFPNDIFVQAEVNYFEDDFDESGGGRSATEETSTLTLSIGRKF